MSSTAETTMSISKNYQENVSYLNQKLGVPESFDIVLREMNIGGKKIAIYSVNGMISRPASNMILEVLSKIERVELAVNAVDKLVKSKIVDLQVSEVEAMDEVIYFLLSGTMAILIEGRTQAIIVDLRTYPGRMPQEPDIERVTRGSRDGFTETLVFNTILIRRRLRDPGLRMKLVKAGSRSKTDVCIAYIEDITNPKMVEYIEKEIKNIKIDGIPMAEKTVEEFILGSKFWNPFPRVRYTERPDVAAIHLLEGNVIVMVDTSPSIIIAPCTFWHHVQHAEEYRQEPVVGMYLRWVRFIAIFLSVFLTPLWLAAALNPQLLPEGLQFIGVQKPARIPLLFQVLMGELSIDMLRMAAIHTPSPLATALGLIAVFMMGDVAIQVGLFTPEVVMYTAIAAVGTFATPSYELAQANRLVRLFLVLAAGLFNFWGFGAGVLLVLFVLLRTNSFGVPYLWPLIPMDIKALSTILIRNPVPINNLRPSIFKPKDRIRQPKDRQTKESQPKERTNP
ncbi:MULTISPECIES: spore germination protein [Dehalobacter]|jgi:stage V sporulation protein AF|uniref:Spore germination protein n=2 Tax=Dehalobacter restrictus TaxID=55583 RepID=A0A857DJ80_9FIRM|nr:MULTISPECIES: spore germination protein [Dehalobacter]AHF09833.1 stage V sporulation protein AF [Dehalobacter restrictus DSM 9455]MCG1026119.1 spore germination protein [Dehalobacter sp.]MDJ0305048.1 spore germination protein [Dehalobacter sp.]OCZ53454.1 spore gernimation protein GerA [Dehalobacter sp. TeCB1]QHA00415.1 spore germination protein [Dehalobacter restrictus]